MRSAADYQDGEQERLRALYDLHVLDTPPSERFDRIARLAAGLAGAPMAVIGLVDADRVWFKARLGMPAPEVPRLNAFCARTVEHRDLLHVRDATEDPHFKTHPFVAGPPHLRTYVAVPLAVPCGHVVGTLAVMSDEILEIGPDILGHLGTLAAITMDELQRWRDEAYLRETSMELAQLRESEALARKKLQESEERLRLATEASGIGVWDWDLKADDVRDTGTLLRLLGYDPAVMPGGFRPHQVLIHPDDKPVAETTMRDYLMGRLDEYRCEFRLRAADGSYRWILAQGQITERGNRGLPRRFVGTHTDVTPLVAIKEDMRRAAVEAQAASKAKSDFLAHMSHELRTPLNGVLGMAQVLLTDHALSPVQKDYLNVIKDSGRTLLTLVNDILDISLIEAGGLKLERKPFDLIDLMNRAAAIWRPIASAKGLQLSLDMSGILHQYLHGDPDRIRQVLMNIVSNAIKFTTQGSVTVSVTQEENEDGLIECTFSVTDTGIGIPESDRDRLFTMFEQLDMSVTRSFGGSGLGLAIAKGIVDALGGEISVESAVGKGSTFWFTIAMEDVPGEEDTDEDDGAADSFGPSVSAGRRLRILVAEDAPDNLAVLRAVLHAIYGQDRVAITAVATGIEAVGAVIDHDFDLVLMDVRMPGMDGLEATRRIRNLGGIKGAIPIIAITAHAMKGDREKYIRGGMTDYISKPIDAKVLIEKIDALTSALATP